MGGGSTFALRAHPLSAYLGRAGDKGQVLQIGIGRQRPRGFSLTGVDLTATGALLTGVSLTGEFSCHQARPRTRFKGR
eukprot:3040760-Prymnesium_polylepis.1